MTLDSLVYRRACLFAGSLNAGTGFFFFIKHALWIIIIIINCLLPLRKYYVSKKY